MTFEELTDTLPNGFHDAELHAFRMDYVQRRLIFDLEIFIGEVDNERRREVYRPAVVVLDDVRFLYVEPPRESKELHIVSSIRIDTGEGVPKTVEDRLQHLRDAGPITWMFMNELNSFIFFAGSRATLEWTGPEENGT